MQIRYMAKTFNTDYTAVNCLFAAVKLTKNADLKKYNYID